MRTPFRRMLAERQQKVASLVCVGLDPIEEKIPDDAGDVEDWMMYVVDQTAPFASMYKPNSGYWEAFNDGSFHLSNVISYIHNVYPDIPVLLDGKRGDIARTQQMYRKAHLDREGQDADGMTFSPYMGKDTMSALVNSENLGKALVGLCYTSNPDAREIQDAILMFSTDTIWEFIARLILSWAEELGVTRDAGLVMAAAYEEQKGSGRIYSDHLRRCRKIVGDEFWFLIPGIGTQGGFIAETVKAAYRGPGSIAINSSSGIIFAEDPGAAARDLRDQINAAIP